MKNPHTKSKKKTKTMKPTPQTRTTNTPQHRDQKKMDWKKKRPTMKTPIIKVNKFTKVRLCVLVMKLYSHQAAMQLFSVQTVVKYTTYVIVRITI